MICVCMYVCRGRGAEPSILSDGPGEVGEGGVMDIERFSMNDIWRLERPSLNQHLLPSKRKSIDINKGIRTHKN